MEGSRAVSIQRNAGHSSTSTAPAMQAGNPVTMLERQALGSGRGHLAELMDRRLESASHLYNRDLRGHFGCINAIEFSQSGSLMVSGGDDRRVLVWDVARTISGSPMPTVPLVSQHLSNIFCLAFDASEKHVFSAGNDKQIIVHDLNTGAAVDVFTEQQTIYGLHVDPCQEKVFVASCENGRVLLFDLRMSLADPVSLAEEGASLAAYYSVMFSPAETRLVAAANSKSGAAVYDVAMPGRVLQRYGGSRYGAMSARYSSDGRRLFVLRRRLPPALYDLRSSPAPLCQFDNPLYYNSCTMKSCCFAGSRDQYVLSGSDDFSLYMWKIPDNPEVRHVSRAHAVLRGHRSIVNQVRFCPHNGLLASSGVEKVVKLWSPMRLPDSQGGLEFDPEMDDRQRRIPRQGEYVDMMVSAAEDAFGPDMNAQTTQEDPRMLAFFDSLVQREIEALTTETDSSSEEEGVGRGGHQHNSDDAAEYHSYFAATSDMEEAGRGCDNMISRMIERKRGQLMRAARLRRRRALGGAGGDSSGAEDGASPGPDERRRRVLHKARYVWLPMSGYTRYTARAPPAAELASDGSEDGGPEPRPVPGAPPSRRRPGRLQLADEQPSGSGLQSSASSSGGPRPSRPLSSASSGSSESSDEPPSRRRRLGKLLTTLSSRSAPMATPPSSSPAPTAAAAAAAAMVRSETPLTNGNTKDNFSRLKRSDFRRRNYRRRY